MGAGDSVLILDENSLGFMGAFRDTENVGEDHNPGLLTPDSGDHLMCFPGRQEALPRAAFHSSA